MLFDVKSIEKALAKTVAALLLLEHEWLKICIGLNEPMFTHTAIGLEQISQTQIDLLSLEYSLLMIKGELMQGTGDRK